MIKINLNVNDIVYIFGEKFLIKNIIKESRIIKKENQKFYTYRLDSEDENILHSEISIYSKNEIFFKTIRKIDCIIKSNAINYNNKIYQIFKEYYNVEYNPRNGKIERSKIYELHDTTDSKILLENPRRIIVNKNGNKIFHNFQNIDISDIKREKKEKKEIKRPIETKKFKIKFKEQIG